MPQGAHNSGNSPVPVYAARRLLNPFRGVVQYVEWQGYTATSRDGDSWQLYGDDGFGWVRPVGLWQGIPEHGGRLLRGAALPVGFRAALEAMPALPFPADDRAECWLLDESGRPMALLASAPQPFDLSGPGVSGGPVWQAFTPRYTGFVSPHLHAAGLAPDGHAAWLTQRVRQRAGEAPQAAWFAGRQAAPLLIAAIDAEVNNLLEQSAMADYHHHVAALLLAWPGLTTAERAAFEAVAFTNPVATARAYRLWPAVLDVNGLAVARVAAQLVASQQAPR